jgi:hypothetical protein
MVAFSTTTGNGASQTRTSLREQVLEGTAPIYGETAAKAIQNKKRRRPYARHRNEPGAAALVSIESDIGG